MALSATFRQAQALTTIPTGEEEYPELPAWIDRVRDVVPGYEAINDGGANAFTEFFKGRLQEASKED